ncbi:MAG: glycosyltransferase [Oscillospiraceae bacterium]|nr:glycosyltransferase [Oscillospiraceae bacterium]
MSGEILAAEGYSVLMAVYAGSVPGELRSAVESMLAQTLPTDDFVLVCDGPLTDALDVVITSFTCQFPGLFQILRLPRHRGLVAALNAGLPLCRHELVARMDSDDISLPHRCQRQADFFAAHPELHILSGTVLEFTDHTDNITGMRLLPSGDRNIRRFSRKRSPFNHPAVMYRKSAVAAAGGYREDHPLFEDYDLWVRMLCAGFRGENLREPLLFMRAGPGMYRRRGGMRYARNLLRFHRELWRSGWSGPADYIAGAVPHALACVLPTELLGRVYGLLHRKAGKDTERGYPALQPFRGIPG